MNQMRAHASVNCAASCHMSSDTNATTRMWAGKLKRGKMDAMTALFEAESEIQLLNWPDYNRDGLVKVGAGPMAARAV